MTSIEQLLADNHISILFQPIVSAGHASPLGYEALARGPQFTPYFSAGALFALARATAKQTLLEQHCLELALARFQQLASPSRSRLFVNLSPSVLFQIGVNPIYQLTQRYNLAPERLVIEITEQQSQEEIPLSNLVAELQHCGIGVALDDLGSAFSGLRRWMELKPDYVKLDRCFVTDIEQSTQRQRFVSQLIRLAQDTGSQFIVEGVETRSQWQCLLGLGVRHVQGFAIACPAADLAIELPEMPPIPHSEIWEGNLRKMRQFVHPVPTLTANQPCQQALELFNSQLNLQCIPVVDEQGIAQGLLRREQLLTRFAERFGHALYSRQPVSRLMDPEPILIESSLDPLQVSQQLLEQNNLDMDSWFLICEQGRFLGLGYLSELVRQLTEYKIRMAQHANPLTLLPGNVPIHMAIEQAIDKQQAFYLVYCDLNHFKPYNDVCGYDRGDQVICQLADLLRHHVGHPHNFLGHLGGDDFILILKANDWSGSLERLQHAFQQARRQFYREADWLRGGIEGLDRDGNKRLFPLLTLAIGVVAWSDDSGMNRSQLIDALTVAKKRAKQNQTASYWLFDCEEVALLAG